MYVHETSIVEHTALIGQRTKIWHFSHIDDGVRIGKDCSFGQNTYVGKLVYIGDRVKVQNNVSIWTGVEIGSDVFIGPNVTFTNIKHPRAFINQKGSFEETIIMRGATLGANCTLLAPVKIGEEAVVAAGAVVGKDVPDYCVVVGNPAKVVRGVYKYAVVNKTIESMVAVIPKGTIVRVQFTPNLNKWKVESLAEPVGHFIYEKAELLTFIPTEEILLTHPEQKHRIKIF